MVDLQSLWILLHDTEGEKQIIKDFSEMQSDLFFEKYAGANYINDPRVISYDNQNYVGRINAYLDLLDLVRKNNKISYANAHKGTPYCFLGWLYMDIGEYEKGIFYIDAACSEDIKTDPGEWQNRPAPKFLFLETSGPNSPIGERIIKKTRTSIESELTKFNDIINKELTISQFVSGFVKPKIDISTHRTIITSVYTFILEGIENIELLRRRSSNGGTLEPFLNHLHKGSLILESLLKETYTSTSNLTLDPILKDPFIMRDLDISIENTGKIGRTLDDIVNHLIQPKRSGKGVQNQWFTVSIALRNVTSHSLLLPDVFNDKTYGTLYRQILFSIFYLISKKY